MSGKKVYVTPCVKKVGSLEQITLGGPNFDNPDMDGTGYNNANQDHWPGSA
jgi:hypothetical protein